MMSIISHVSPKTVTTHWKIIVVSLDLIFRSARQNTLELYITHYMDTVANNCLENLEKDTSF